MLRRYALFNYDSASEKFTADPNSLSDCENAWHVAVKAMEYIFDPYQKGRTAPASDIKQTARRI